MNDGVRIKSKFCAESDQDEYYCRCSVAEGMSARMVQSKSMITFSRIVVSWNSLLFLLLLSIYDPTVEQLMHTPIAKVSIARNKTGTANVHCNR